MRLCPKRRLYIMLATTNKYPVCWSNGAIYSTLGVGKYWSYLVAMSFEDVKETLNDGKWKLIPKPEGLPPCPH